MGNTNQPYDAHIEQIKRSYIPRPELSNQAYGKGNVYQNKTDRAYVIEKIYNTDQNILAQLQNLQEKSEHIIKLIGKYQNGDDNICSTIGSVSVFYEFLPNSLEKFIEIRQQINQLFNESELWFILLHLVEFNVQLHHFNKAHRDIRPQNVLYSEDFKQIKFAPIGTFPNDMNAIQKKIRGEITYLAPEYQGTVNQNIDWHKNDVYACGLTLLDSMTLHMLPLADQNRLNFARNYYSQQFLSLFEEMISYNQDDRPSFFDLNVFLQPYRHQIKLMQSFIFEHHVIMDSFQRSSNVNIQCFQKLLGKMNLMQSSNVQLENSPIRKISVHYLSPSPEIVHSPSKQIIFAPQQQVRQHEYNLQHSQIQQQQLQRKEQMYQQLPEHHIIQQEHQIIQQEPHKIIYQQPQQQVVYQQPQVQQIVRQEIPIYTQNQQQDKSQVRILSLSPSKSSSQALYIQLSPTSQQQYVYQIQSPIVQSNSYIQQLQPKQQIIMLQQPTTHQSYIIQPTIPVTNYSQILPAQLVIQPALAQVKNKILLFIVKVSPKASFAPGATTQLNINAVELYNSQLQSANLKQFAS